MHKIEKEFTYRGETTTVYFRELTAGEQLNLSRGYKSVFRDGSSEVELDFFAEGERGHKLLQMMLVDVDGKNVYSNVAKLREENTSKIAKLVKMANEASKEFSDEDADAGND